MKYLLTPFTMLLFYFTSYLGLYFSVFMMLKLFTMSWLYLCFFYPLSIGLIFAITNSIPTILKIYIFKLYNFSWFSVISHVLASLIGLINIFIFFYDFPPEFITKGQSYFFLKGWWEDSPIKTLLLIFPFIGLLISFSWSTVMAPILIKLEDD